MKTRIAVLISGNGSNLQALIDACKQPDFPAEIATVISNRADAYGVNRASLEGIPAHVIDHNDYAGREAFDRAMQELLLHHVTEFVCLAGFMRLLSPWFVKAWQGKLINIHPSYLPEFKGGFAVRDALSAGVKETGCSVHYVTDDMDSGKIILQSRVPVLPGDTQETLRERIHAEEHKIYPQALKMVLSK